jgi:SAM-dependent methyltransferase
VDTLPPDPWETDDRERFRARFGEDLDAYDRTRPVAPGAVFDDIVQRAGLKPGATVVEIGPGTGQATRPLAHRGLHVLALEIDPRLAARAIRTLAPFPDVAVKVTSFEAWHQGEATVDAVFACNSFHWIDPGVRFTKTAGLLAGHGHLIVMSTPVVVPPDANRFWWDVQDDWSAVGAGRVDPATKHPDSVDDFGSEVRASGVFEEPTVTRYRFDVSRSADDFVANLSTQTGMKQLPLPARAELLARVRRRIESQGGWLTIHHVAVVTTAKLATGWPGSDSARRPPRARHPPYLWYGHKLTV